MSEFLINGNTNMQVNDMKSGHWERWRIVNGGWDAGTVRLSFEAFGGATVNWYLLAKDGVYVSDYPREISSADFAAGNRVDFMVRCSGTTGSAGTGCRFKVGAGDVGATMAPLAASDTSAQNYQATNGPPTTWNGL